MVTELIDLLSKEDSLVKPLLQTFTFARRIGNEELAGWALNELNGYQNTNNHYDDKNLPSYRFVRHNMVGVMRQNGRLTKETSLPLSCFGDILEEKLSRRIFDESIATLEGMVKNSDNQYIIKVLPADFCSGLTQQAKANRHSFEVISCREIVGIPEVAGIIIAIKTKLLDLLLAIERQYPSIDIMSPNFNTKSQLNTTVNYYMGQIYNISSSGIGSLVNTGNDNNNTINNDH